MASIQVIDRQQDPTAKMMADVGESIAGTIQKQQSLKLTGQYYKILAKNADTDADKAKFDRLAKLNTDFLPQIAGTTDPATKSMLIKAISDSGLYNGDSNQMFRDIADSHPQVMGNHQTVAGSPYQAPSQGGQQPPGLPTGAPQGAPQAPAVPPAPSTADQMGAMQGPAYATPGQVGGAQATEARLGALQSLTIANLIRKQMGQPPLDQNGNPVATSAGQPTNANAPSQSGGSNETNYSMPVIHTPAGDLVDTNAMAAQKKEEAMATREGEKQVDLKGAQEAYDNYYNKLQDALQEQGGEQNTMAGSVMGGVRGTMGQFTTPGSSVAALHGALMPLAVRVTSLLNSGRGNLPEVKADMQMFPSRFSPAATNAYRDQNMRSLLKMDPNASIQDRREMYNKVITANKEFDKAQANPETPRSQAMKQLTGAAKTLDPQTASALLKQAGGNKDAARALAKQQGYTF